jgi:hypothetical protein
MKTALETNIDSEWSNFLMGCGRDEEPPCYNKKSQNSSLKKKTTKISTTYEKNDDDGRNGRLCTKIQSPLDALNTIDAIDAIDSKHNGNNNNDNSDYGDDVRFDNDVGIRESQDDSKIADIIEVPTCSPIYISTKTKILFLDTPIDIKKVFWEIPIMPYASQCCGIIKKQIKFSCTTKEELEEIEANTQKEIDKNDGFIETQIIEHIDNPEGRIKFKDHRKINIGLSKKDILNCRCKKKRAFFNCFVLIVRVEDENSPPGARTFKEMHIKVFNTGKLEIPGIQHDNSLKSVIDILIHRLKIVIGDHIDCRKDKCETVLIN